MASVDAGGLSNISFCPKSVVRGVIEISVHKKRIILATSFGATG